MKKGITLVLALIFAVSMLAGCAGDDPPAPAAPAPADSAPAAADSAPAAPDPDPGQASGEPVTVTILMDNQSAMEGIYAVTAEIERRFNIKTEIEFRPGGDEGDNVVRTRLATGEMADLMWYNSGALFMALGPDAYFMDLTNEPFMDNIDEGFKATVSVDGVVYGIPTGAGMGGGWLYNKRVYEELGLSVPSTWDQLLANCQVAQDAGKIPVMATYRDSWTSQLILLADYYNVYTVDPGFADRYTANQAKFADTPVALKGFERLAEIGQRGFMNSDHMAATYEEGLEMLATGEAAHYPMLTFALSAITEQYGDLINDIGIFGQPGDDPNDHGLTLWASGGIYLNKNSPHTDALLTWASFWASPEGAELYMSVLPPDGPMAILGVDLPDTVAPAVLDMQVYADAGKTAPALEFITPLKGPNLPQITVECGAGITSPMDSALAYDDDVEKQAQQLNLPGW